MACNGRHDIVMPTNVGMRVFAAISKEDVEGAPSHAMTELHFRAIIRITMGQEFLLHPPWYQLCRS
jgi:hypothetical protein